MDIKMMHEMIEKITECAKHEMDKGIEAVDTKEMGEVTDIIKDLAEAMYYRKLTEAMKEYEYGEDYDEYGPMDDGRRGYIGQPRDSMGRYTSRRRDGRRMGYEEPPYYHMNPDMYREHDPEYWRDMDRKDGKMYYTEPITTESRYDKARRGYEESKMTHKANTPEDKQQKMKSLEAYTKELAEDVTEMISDMSAEEKNLLRTKLQTLAQKVS